MKTLLYCNKAKPYLIQNPNWIIKMVKHKYIVCEDNLYIEDVTVNGKVVAECDFEVEEIYYKDGSHNDAELGILGLRTKSMPESTLLEKSCLSYNELDNYLDEHGYAIHIKNLKIFGQPKELSDYVIKRCQFGKCSSCEHGKKEILCSTINDPLTKAPQNMMYVYDWFGNKGVLISIKPEHLYKILNGDKTIEIRKKVLKEML